MNSNNPWQTYVLLCGMSALVGGGCGAGAALMFAERRVSEVEASVDSLDERVKVLEGLENRVSQLEAGSEASPPRIPKGT